MHFMKATLLMSLWLNLFDFIQSAPYFGIDDDDDYGIRSELRRKHKMKKKRPCGRSDEGKTFFPFQVSYINVNYNYNCGGNSHVPYDHSDDASDGNRPHKPHRPLHQFINSKPLADPLSSQDDTNASGQNKPNKPLINFLQNHNNGGFFGLFDGSLINNLFGSKPKPPASAEEIPVHEDLDDVTQDVTEKLSPGQYITAYNPLTGQYLQEMPNFKPKRILKQISGIFEPIYDIF